MLDELCLLLIFWVNFSFSCLSYLLYIFQIADTRFDVFKILWSWFYDDSICNYFDKAAVAVTFSDFNDLVQQSFN